MKKFLNKKTLAAAILAIALAATAIGTYAYWIIDIPSEEDPVGVAILDYDVTENQYYDVGDTIQFEPGGRFTYDGGITLTQYHSMSSFILKVPAAVATTTIKNAPKDYPGDPNWYTYKEDDSKDTRYNPIQNPWEEWVASDSKVKIEYDTAYIGERTLENGFLWVQDKTAGYGDYYVYVYGKPTVDFDDDGVIDANGVRIAFDAKFAEDAGLKYMGAEVSFDTTWRATQVRYAAINEAFGDGRAFDADEMVDPALNWLLNLTPVEGIDFAGSPPRGGSSAMTAAQIWAKFQAELWAE